MSYRKHPVYWFVRAYIQHFNVLSIRRISIIGIEIHWAFFLAGSPWNNSSGCDDERRPAPKEGKKSNVLPLWGNERTMNLNPLILTNIQSSHYFKVNLYELKTYHEVIDEIYYKVSHLEPWEKGSRKTAGQTGMCGGVSMFFQKEDRFFFLLLPLFFNYWCVCWKSEACETCCTNVFACTENWLCCTSQRPVGKLSDESSKVIWMQQCVWLVIMQHQLLL